MNTDLLLKTKNFIVKIDSQFIVENGELVNPQKCNFFFSFFIDRFIESYFPIYIYFKKLIIVFAFFSSRRKPLPTRYYKQINSIRKKTKTMSHCINLFIFFSHLKSTQQRHDLCAIGYPKLKMRNFTISYLLLIDQHVLLLVLLFVLESIENSTQVNIHSFFFLFAFNYTYPLLR